MSLPNVFQNKNIELNENNQQELFYGNQEKKQNRFSSYPQNIDSKINQLFSSLNYVYKLNVHVITKDNSFDTIIIGKNHNSLITYDNELINIKDIIDIYEK